MQIPSNKRNCNITIESERNTWDNELLHKLIPVPEVCKKCQIGKIGLKRNNSLLNPYFGKCGYYKCNIEY